MKTLWNKFVILIWLFCIRHAMYIPIPFNRAIEISEKEINMVVHILNNRHKDVLEVNKDYCHIFNFLTFLLKHDQEGDCWQHSHEQKKKILEFYDMCKESIVECENRFDG